jgi:hypothetical protein
MRFNFLQELLPAKFAEHMKRQYYMDQYVESPDGSFYAWYFARKTIL